jgi:hypothetical protein
METERWQGSAVALVVRDEPANALSIPTWAIHVSSLVEWLVAMGLVWQYAEVCGNPRWKGLTWGMLPLHTSGICACTYHFFYNSEKVEWLVALQVRGPERFSPPRPLSPPGLCGG